MLVLTRKSEQSLVVGNDTDPNGVVTVKVLSIEGNRVKLGFLMNDAVIVDRLEVWNRTQNDTLISQTPRSRER